jgi:drug/metabolite transporter (DMT)-like permease
MAVVFMLPALLLGEALDLPFLKSLAPTSTQWLLLMAIGVIGTFAHLLMTWSLRYAPAATLAPMQYLEIPFATLLGFLIFQDLPNPLASVGIMITIASGLYIILRERAIARGLAAKTPPPQTA